jgi:hypothetical protein
MGTLPAERSRKDAGFGLQGCGPRRDRARAHAARFDRRLPTPPAGCLREAEGWRRSEDSCEEGAIFAIGPRLLPRGRSLDLALARKVSPSLGLPDDDGFVRLLGWWYICIGLAFVGLAARAFMSGAPAWSSWLRVAIAVGFLFLGIVELARTRKSAPPIRKR